MDRKIDKIKKVRQFILEQITGLSDEQLNKIPAGFTNNIIWNLAHLICAQQSICYLRAGQQVIVPDKFITPFFTNTKPERILEYDEIQEIKRLFLSTIDQLQLDFESGMFSSYTPSPNILRIYGIDVHSIEDALEFVLYHEGYHSGSILALKKLVG